MRGILWLAGLGGLVMSGCSDQGDASDGSDDGVGGDEGTGDGGGSGGSGGDDGGDDWLATGSGTATLTDGTAPNSALALEMVGVSSPGDGMGYHAWLTGGSEGDLYLGEIEVAAEGELEWSVDTEADILAAGHAGLEVWRGGGEDALTAGEPVWSGTFNEDLAQALTTLLSASDSTLDGSGSVRAIATTLGELQGLAQAASEQTLEIEAYWAAAEEVANGITGEGRDYDGSGEVLSPADTAPILSDEGLVELVLTDLADLSRAVEPGDPVKDYANYAYDCVQRIEGHADHAETHAGLATVCGVDTTCAGELADAAEDLGFALDGSDDNEDGVIDSVEEGGATCAVSWVQAALSFEVAAGG